MVPTQGGVSFPCGLFYCLLLLPGIMSDQNTTMLAQPPHLRGYCKKQPYDLWPMALWLYGLRFCCLYFCWAILQSC